MICGKKLHTLSIGQSTHQDLVKKSGLWRILVDSKSGLQRLFLTKILLLSILGWTWSEVFGSVYQFIDGENDSGEVFKRSASVDIIWFTRRDRDAGEQTAWINRVSLKAMYVWGVNSTVTKHSDYFVWKDKLERVTRRCDDTVDKKRVNSCILNYLFWREFSNHENRQKNPEILSPTRY